MNVWSSIKRAAANLLKADGSPHSLALGFAVGTFFGFSPFFGVKTLLSLFAAFLLRCNKVSTLFALALHETLYPLAPFLIVAEYKLGCKLMGLDAHRGALKIIERHESGFAPRWDHLLREGEPLVLGGLIVSLAISVPAYFAVRLLIERARGRKAIPPSA